MTALFTPGFFKSVSGRTLPFKIECDALSPEDWRAMAELVARRINFRFAVPVPRGGVPFAAELNLISTNRANPGLPVLVVDDVLTTGASMERVREEVRAGYFEGEANAFILGVVLFARAPAPPWVEPIFQLTEEFQ